jgi:hypothetical protein
MKRIDGIYDHNVFLSFRCRDCEHEACVNPSELVSAGVPMCFDEDNHGEMEYNGVEVIVREEQ